MKNHLISILRLAICVGLMAHFSSAVAIESSAADATPQSGKAEMRAQPSGNKHNDDPSIICKREKVLGSNMRKRVCYRVKDIKARRTSDREDMRERQIQTPRPTLND